MIKNSAREGKKRKEERDRLPSPLAASVYAIREFGEGLYEIA